MGGDGGDHRSGSDSLGPGGARSWLDGRWPPRRQHPSWFRSVDEPALCWLGRPARGLAWSQLSLRYGLRQGLLPAIWSGAEEPPKEPELVVLIPLQGLAGCGLRMLGAVQNRPQDRESPLSWHLCKGEYSWLILGPGHSRAGLASEENSPGSCLSHVPA